jgi:serine/threonine-protein kinase RsbW
MTETPEQPLPLCEFDGQRLILRLDETIAADGKAVHRLIERIMAAVRSVGCAPGREDHVHLALDEALTNAVVHGCQGDATKSIQCCVACDDQRGVLIVVRDPGPGFDPASIPSPTVGENLYASHGRGIFLINQLSDEVRFEQGGTEIQIRIR